MPICKYYVVYIINYNTEYGLISVNKYISNKIWQREDTLDPETANILFIYVFFFFFFWLHFIRTFIYTKPAFSANFTLTKTFKSAS